MFNLTSNTMFNSPNRVLRTLGMDEKHKHPSIERLLEVVAQRGIYSHGALAAAMSLSDQVITNWAARGISATGALKAQKIFGCSALWILEGIGSALPHGYSPAALTLAWTLDQITDPMAKKQADTAASAVILDILQQIESPPTDKRVRHSGLSILS